MSEMNPSTALLQLLSDGETKSMFALSQTLGLTEKQVSNASFKLVRRGLLIRRSIGFYSLSEEGIQAAKRGEVIKSGPYRHLSAPRARRNSFRERVWRSMRFRRRFTVRDLIADAATPEDKRPEDNIHRYLRSLSRAGYVQSAPKRAAGDAVTSPGFKRWILLKNTGPLSPLLTNRDRVVHDRNTGEDVPCFPV